MSIPSKPPMGGPPVNGHTRPEVSHYRPIATWQLPKLMTRSQSITPASTPSRTSFSPSSSPPMNAQSYTTSPDGPLAFEHSDLEKIPPLTLPTSPPASQPTSPPVDPSISCRPPSIIRRISRGANRLRGRSSASNMRVNRDQNAGTVIRRRSDSRSMVDGSYDISDMELEETLEEETDDEPHPLVANTASSEYRSPPRNLSRRSSEKDSNQSPPVPLKAVLFTKVTRKKHKQLRFSLDEDAAKIWWITNMSNVRKQIYIDDIREVRAGDMARNHLAEFQIPDDRLNCWLSIVYFDPERRRGRMTKFMHLIAPDSNTCAQWVKALHTLMRARDSLMSEKHWVGYWQREMIKRFGTNPHSQDDEKMDFASVRKTCRNFSIYKADRGLRQIFDAVTQKSSDTLNQQQYIEFFRRLTERRDIRHVFDEVRSMANSTTNNMTFSEFTNFLRSSQCVDVEADQAHWLAVFDRYALKKRGQPADIRPEENDRSTGMSFEAFREFLLSSNNSALKPLPSAPSLNRPMNEYFISSSHNTYLEGRQVHGESSAEMYVQALKKGCRCIEIDCENGPVGKPYVTHVRTVTSRIPFLDCIKAINQYAFFASDYPLIVSLEVHCNPEQQRLMAEIIKEVFGEQLLLQPLVVGSYALPSPEDLKRKILIKVKVPKDENLFSPLAAFPPTTMGYLGSPAGHRRQRSLSAPNPRMIQQSLAKVHEKQIWMPPNQMNLAVTSMTIITPMTSTPIYPSSATTSVPASSSDDSEWDAGQSSIPQKTKAKSNIVKELGALGVYTRGVKFNDWKSAESRSPNHVYSFNENTFEDRCKTQEGKALLERHNVRSLMRIYPRPTRIQSSNFDPIQFWRRGVQMVATNWQTYDVGTQINDAMFAAGADRTGYVLKPDEMRQFPREASYGQVPKFDTKRIIFSVDIISAQHLEAPADLRLEADMNPYVEFEIYSAEDRDKDFTINKEGGLDSPTRTGKSSIGSPFPKRTQIVPGNGFDPIFGGIEKQTITVTLKTQHPTLVFVRWTVWNSPDGRGLSNSKEPLSSFTAKVSSIEQGYRQLPLYNKHGELLHSKLFCRIRKEYCDVDVDPNTEDALVDQRRISDENGRSGKDILRRVFSRTPSEKRRVPRDNESGYFSRTASTERYIP